MSEINVSPATGVGSSSLQRRLRSNDALNEGIKHIGSTVFAVPPGARQGGYVGETLLG